MTSQPYTPFMLRILCWINFLFCFRARSGVVKRKTVVIDHMSFNGMVFQNCTIIYCGRHLNMANVRFEGCAFALGLEASAGARFIQWMSVQSPEFVAQTFPHVKAHLLRTLKAEDNHEPNQSGDRKV